MRTPLRRWRLSNSPFGRLEQEVEGGAGMGCLTLWWLVSVTVRGGAMSAFSSHSPPSNRGTNRGKLKCRPIAFAEVCTVTEMCFLFLHTAGKNTFIPNHKQTVKVEGIFLDVKAVVSFGEQCGGKLSKRFPSRQFGLGDIWWIFGGEAVAASLSLVNSIRILQCNTNTYA